MQRHVVSNQWFGSGRARNWNARDYELLICCAFTSDLLCCIFVKLSYLWSFIFVAVALCQNWEVDVSFTSVGDHGACQLAQVRLNEVVRHDFFWWWIMFFFTIYIYIIYTYITVCCTHRWLPRIIHPTLQKPSDLGAKFEIQFRWFLL